MAHASQSNEPTPLQTRFAARKPRLHISAIVEQEPPSEYDSVGLELQAHRTRKGHDLEMVGRVLRIRVAHLKAIEDDHFEALPGRTYAVGFVRAYAEYLGLDPEDCLRRFKREYAAATEPAGGEAGAQAKAGMAFPDLREEVRLPHGSIIILTLLLVVAVWGGWYLTTTDERAFSISAGEFAEVDANLDIEGLPSPEEASAILNAVEPDPEIMTTEPVTEAAAEEADPAALEAEVIPEADTAVAMTAPRVPGTDLGSTTASPRVQTASPVPTPTLVAEAQVYGAQNHGARVILRARGDVWVRVEDQDGSVLFERTLHQGDSFRVPNRNGLIMATRNAGALEMIVDGASLGPAGSVGQALLSETLDANVLLANAPQQP